MRIRGTTLRLAVVSSLVVLALTGFSSRHGGHGHGGSGGGGCSSSSQDHDTSSSTSGGVAEDDSYDDSDNSGSYGGGSGGYRYRDRDDDHDDNTGSGSGAKSLDDATVELLDCASASRPYTKVRVTNPNGRKGTFTVTVVLKADLDYELDTVRKKVEVPAGGAVTAKVKLTDRSFAAEIEECDPEPRAPEAG